MAEEFKAKIRGKQAEQMACAFLQQKGLMLVQKNYTSPCGEIDLIMQDRETMVFVEVRMRHHTYLGSAVETVTRAKQDKLIKTALLYLQKKNWLNRVPSRFDIIGLDVQDNIQWIQNAFGLGFI